MFEGEIVGGNETHTVESKGAGVAVCGAQLRDHKWDPSPSMKS